MTAHEEQVHACHEDGYASHAPRAVWLPHAQAVTPGAEAATAPDARGSGGSTCEAWPGAAARRARIDRAQARSSKLVVDRFFSFTFLSTNVERARKKEQQAKSAVGNSAIIATRLWPVVLRHTLRERHAGSSAVT